MGRDLAHGFVARVLRPRPKESSQAVFAAAGHDVHVEMSNALAHLVVQRQERALRAENLLHSAAQKARGGEVRREQVVRQVGEGGDMSLGYEKRVTREEGTDVEEGKGRVVRQNDVGRPVASHDVAEDAHEGER